MYEQVMLLPVFQGISHEQLTDILGKAHFSFRKLIAGEIVADVGHPFEEVIFLLSGEVRVEKTFLDGRVRLAQHYCAPHTLQFYNLFGVETSHAEKIRSTGDAGIMTLSKSDLLNIIRGNDILVINLLNILSSRAQYLSHCLDEYPRMDETMRVVSWLLAYTGRTAYDISVRATTADWCHLLALDDRACRRAFSNLERMHFVTTSGDCVKVIDRYALKLFANETLS